MLKNIRLACSLIDDTTTLLVQVVIEGMAVGLFRVQEADVSFSMSARVDVNCEAKTAQNTEEHKAQNNMGRGGMP